MSTNEPQATAPSSPDADLEADTAALMEAVAKMTPGPWGEDAEVTAFHNGKWAIVCPALGGGFIPDKERILLTFNSHWDPEHDNAGICILRNTAPDLLRRWQERAKKAESRLKEIEAKLAKYEEACGHLMKLAVERLRRAETAEKAHGDCDSTINILIDQKLELEADIRDLAGILDGYEAVKNPVYAGRIGVTIQNMLAMNLDAALARREAGKKVTPHE